MPEQLTRTTSRRGGNSCSNTIIPQLQFILSPSLGTLQPGQHKTDSAFPENKQTKRVMGWWWSSSLAGNGGGGGGSSVEGGGE